MRKNICARRTQVGLINQIFGILTRELQSGSYRILKNLDFDNLYLQLGYVTVGFWLYHKTYTSKLLQCSTLQGFQSCQSFCIQPVFYKVFLQYCCLGYLFLGIPCLKNLNFIYEQIFRLDICIQHLTQIQCILACTACVDPLQQFWVDLPVLATCLIAFSCM